jgi:GDP-L-galactose phosphorylase
LANNGSHVQAYYLAAPFPVERAEVKRIGTLKKKKASVKVFELANYAVRGLVYECVGSLDALAECVARACINLQEKNIPYNVLIADCGMRVFLFPQVLIALSFLLLALKS